jgi:nitrogen fixation NifU-like protein
MSDLSDLYQEVILDHNKRPRNFHEMADASHQALGHNPLCGDRLTVYLRMDGDTVADVAFVGSGCAISKASASMMTESVKGKRRAEADTLFTMFHDLVTGAPGAEARLDELGKLRIFAGVREFPVRVKCASLAWHTLQAAMRRQDKVSTE